jgi:hypothetical protein
VLLLLLFCCELSLAIWDPYAPPEAGGQIILTSGIERNVSKSMNSMTIGGFNVGMYKTTTAGLHCIFFSNYFALFALPTLN